jgi:dihydroorotate dehydrogenase
MAGVDRTTKRLRDVLALRNPIILGSGPLGRNAKGLVKQGHYAGAVVGKSITWLPRRGNPHPRIVSLGELGLINWENLELDFKWGFDPATGKTGYDPDAGGGGFGHEAIMEVVSTLKKTVAIPLIAKLVAFAGDIVQNARAAELAGADAVTAINSIFPSMKIDVRDQKPVLTSRFGGLSGRSILPLAVAAVYRIYAAVSIPIIGCGGVASGEDALEMIMAGADAVQVCTAAMFEGPTVFKRINDELNALMKELGFATLDECRGLAHC